jgi:predicted phage terminase large subunit-like protein
MGHWTYEVFGSRERGPDTELFTARTSDNSFLPPVFADTVRQTYGDGSRLSLQELDGEFLPDGMLMFARHWFKLLDVEPPLKRKVRSWDLAASEVKKDTDPDFTVGCLIGVTEDNMTVISQIVRDRKSPLATEKLILSVADYDTKKTEIVLEVEPGAAAKIYAADLVRKLSGYVVHLRPADGSKAERAAPLSSQTEAGNVAIVRSPWNKDYLDEMEQFPGGRHDDQVDATALGFNHLHDKPTYRGCW